MVVSRARDGADAPTKKSSMTTRELRDVLRWTRTLARRAARQHVRKDEFGDGAKCPRGAVPDARDGGSRARELTIYSWRARAPLKTSRQGCGRTSSSSTKPLNVSADERRHEQLIGHVSEDVPALQPRIRTSLVTSGVAPGHDLTPPSMRTRHLG